ncbi:MULTISPECIES: type IV pilin protein [unclassified Agarivorans]|uniref:type IV pilin protein n=1 Tax=unclassified Agarivorans TaxID=2636026 RepID=UPI003D7E676F
MKQIKGFTLIEVMITVAIVAILAAVAYPSYLSHVQTTRREEAKRTLVEAAQHMESYYSMNLTYSGAASSGSLTIYTPTHNFSDYYTLSTSGMSASAYTLSATPKSTAAQASDHCGTMSINSTGLTTPSSGGCW